jgi:hypothetical protein
MYLKKSTVTTIKMPRELGVTNNQLYKLFLVSNLFLLSENIQFRLKEFSDSHCHL